MKTNQLAKFAAGISLMSAGIALSIRSNLGTTPISTLPVAVNAWNARISVGTATFLMNALFVVALTQDSEALRGRFKDISRKLVMRIYSPLSRDEGETFERLLNKVLTNLENQTSKE